MHATRGTRFGHTQDPGGCEGTSGHSAWGFGGPGSLSVGEPDRGTYPAVSPCRAERGGAERVTGRPGSWRQCVEEESGVLVCP